LKQFIPCSETDAQPLHTIDDLGDDAFVALISALTITSGKRKAPPL
jgi:hypothetical protein